MNETTKLMLRIPIEVRDWVKDFAKGSDRSMNNQIVAILKEKKAQLEGQKNATQ